MKTFFSFSHSQQIIPIRALTSSHWVCLMDEAIKDKSYMQKGQVLFSVYKGISIYFKSDVWFLQLLLHRST